MKHKLYSTWIFVLKWKYIFVLLLNIITITASLTYKELVAMYQLMEPYGIPNKTRPKDLHYLNACECPRVYWPACGNDNVTYVNVCILQCLNKSLIRYGPCITYRRNQVEKIILYVPSAWKAGSNDSIK